jgi:hypothetical protein
MPLKKSVTNIHGKPLGMDICKHDDTGMENGLDICEKCKEILNQDYY